MLRPILLLTPVYISLFWSIILLHGNRKNENSRPFMGIFMIIAFIVYLSHFLYFLDKTQIYYLIDPLYQLCSLLIYPMYYVYFRLLTAETAFSLKRHAKFIILPFALTVLYFFGYLFADKNLFLKWIYNNNLKTNDFFISYLKIIMLIIKISYILQLIIVIYGNFRLIKEYSNKMSNYYSDVEQTSNKRIQFLNFLLIITSATSISIVAFGKYNFQQNNVALLILSIIFSSMLFYSGWFAFKQKYIPVGWNDNIQLEESQVELAIAENLTRSQQKILDKLLFLFNENKVHLNSKLNIVDVANEIGTNRTYLSTLINQKYNYNFCSFVNDFRLKEMEQLLKQDAHITNHILSESCGFGSVDSMRRVIVNKTGKSFAAWKSEITKQTQM